MGMRVEACPLCAIRTEGLSAGERKQVLDEYLRENHRGIDNAVFSRVLEELFGIGGRDIRRMVSDLRKEGHPICSNFNKGYYYADNQDEINMTVRGLNEHASGVATTVRNLRDANVTKAGDASVNFVISLREEKNGYSVSLSIV